MTAIADSSKNELRYIAAAESSPDAVLMYDCIRSRNGEILDFKFTFLNSNAELMTGIGREQALGENLYEVLPSLRNPKCFAIYKEVVQTGNPAFIELTY